METDREIVADRHAHKQRVNHNTKPRREEEYGTVLLSVMETDSFPTTFLTLEPGNHQGVI